MLFSNLIILTYIFIFFLLWVVVVIRHKVHKKVCHEELLKEMKNGKEQYLYCHRGAQLQIHKKKYHPDQA